MKKSRFLTCPYHQNLWGKSSNLLVYLFSIILLKLRYFCEYVEFVQCREKDYILSITAYLFYLFVYQASSLAINIKAYKINNIVHHEHSRGLYKIQITQ